MSFAEHEGIVDPSVDDLLGKAESKYGLVIFGARRARQINAYYSQLQEGLFEHVGPLVDTHANEKSLSIAMREIEGDVIEAKHVEGGRFNENGQLIHDGVPSADFFESGLFASGIEETSEPIVEFDETAEVEEVAEQAPAEETPAAPEDSEESSES